MLAPGSREGLVRAAPWVEIGEFERRGRVEGTGPGGTSTTSSDSVPSNSLPWVWVRFGFGWITWKSRGASREGRPRISGQLPGARHSTVQVIGLAAFTSRGTTLRDLEVADGAGEPAWRLAQRAARVRSKPGAPGKRRTGWYWRFGKKARIPDTPDTQMMSWLVGLRRRTPGDGAIRRGYGRRGRSVGGRAAGREGLGCDQSSRQRTRSHVKVAANPARIVPSATSMTYFRSNTRPPIRSRAAGVRRADRIPVGEMPVEPRWPLPGCSGPRAPGSAPFVFTANSGIVMSCCFETRTAEGNRPRSLNTCR